MALSHSRWGAETRLADVLLWGAGAVRGGGVGDVQGHNAAMAVLERCVRGPRRRRSAQVTAGIGSAR